MAFMDTTSEKMADSAFMSTDLCSLLSTCFSFPVSGAEPEWAPIRNAAYESGGEHHFQSYLPETLWA